MLITSLRQTSPEHVTVCLDDGGEIRATFGVVTELRLFRGRELDFEALQTLQTQARRALAREKALQLVSRRQLSAKELGKKLREKGFDEQTADLSAKELGKKLREKGFDEQTADCCVSWITERGLINEESYAAAIVRHYAAKGYGEGHIRQELLRRGIPRELRDEALSAMPESTEKLDRFIAQRLKDPGDRDAVRRLSAALFRRGYGGEEIRAALARFQTSLEDE